MEPSFRIRRGTPDDIPVITRHRLGMMQEMRLATPEQCAVYDPEFRTFALQEMTAGNFHSFLAETKSGEVVGGGAVYIVPWPGNPSDRLQRRAFLLNVFTEPDHRRRGIARAVVSAIIDWSRGRGLHSLRLLASDAGRPLYASLGFHSTNEMKLEL